MYRKTESSTKEINIFEGMKVSHLALESKTNSNLILLILLLLCLKGIACLLYLKCPNIYGIHMHVYLYMRQYIEHYSIYLL